jgi:hypothetical protein
MRFVTWREFNQLVILFDAHAVVLLSQRRVIMKIMCCSVFFSFASFFFTRIHNEVV